MRNRRVRAPVRTKQNARVLSLCPVIIMAPRGPTTHLASILAADNHGMAICAFGHTKALAAAACKRALYGTRWRRLAGLPMYTAPR